MVRVALGVTVTRAGGQGENLKNRLLTGRVCSGELTVPFVGRLCTQF